MITIRNNAAITTPVSIPVSGSVVPFDTVVMNTNNNAELSSNAVIMSNVGVYGTMCAVTVENAGSSTVNVVLALNAQGSPVAGAAVEVTVPANVSVEALIDYPQRVVAAENGKAAFSWTISGGAVNLTNAIAKVYRYC